jgi:hypothetical protein
MKAIKATRLLERNMQKWLVKATLTLINCYRLVPTFNPQNYSIHAVA